MIEQICQRKHLNMQIFVVYNVSKEFIPSSLVLGRAVFDWVSAQLIFLLQLHNSIGRKYIKKKDSAREQDYQAAAVG